MEEQVSSFTTRPVNPEKLSQADWYRKKYQGALERILGASHTTLMGRAYDLGQKESRQAFMDWFYDLHSRVAKELSLR